MPSTTPARSHHPTRPAPAHGTTARLKSPLAAPSGTSAVPVPAADAEGAMLTGTVLSASGATLDEFEDYLRTVNNRDGRPYEEKTIVNYVGPVIMLKNVGCVGCVACVAGRCLRAGAGPGCHR
jgi:hypothetical protein